MRRPERQRRLLASLAASGQQTPIVVIAAEQADRYLVIDGYQRIAALQQLGRDWVEAVVWSLSEAEALLLDRSMVEVAGFEDQQFVNVVKTRDGSSGPRA